MRESRIGEAFLDDETSGFSLPFSTGCPLQFFFVFAVYDRIGAEGVRRFIWYFSAEVEASGTLDGDRGNGGSVDEELWREVAATFSSLPVFTVVWRFHQNWVAYLEAPMFLE